MAEQVPHGALNAVPDPDFDGSLGCKCKGKKDRNLVVCIDGTSNKFDVQPKNTNVVELYSQLLKADGKQLTFYHSVVGTYAQPWHKSLLSHMKLFIGSRVDFAIAWGFDKALIGAYRWLSDVYQPGDRIFLFGFSRGAYQIRTLSAMIELVGLIHRGNEAQIPFAFELYTHCSDEIYQKATDVNNPNMGFDTWAKMLDEPKNQNDSTIKALRFKATFSREDAHVHFVGAWDTVSSISFSRQTLPLTCNGMKHVCYFRHALALDERRVNFLPELAYGGATLPATEASKPVSKYTTWIQTKEVWFTGTHSDIGGVTNIHHSELQANRPSLRWMLQEAIRSGLHEGPFRREYRPSAELVRLEPFTPFWWYMELVPLKVLTYQDKDHTTSWPHRGRCRPIVEGQLIHVTVRRDKRDEKLKDRLPPSWDGKVKFEQDTFDIASDLLKKLDTNLSQDQLPDIMTSLKELSQISRTYEGRLGLRELKNSAQTLDKILYDPSWTTLEEQRTVAMLVISILLDFARGLLPRRPLSELPQSLQNMPGPQTKTQLKKLTQFIRTFFTAEINRVEAPQKRLVVFQQPHSNTILSLHSLPERIDHFYTLDSTSGNVGEGKLAAPPSRSNKASSQYLLLDLSMDGTKVASTTVMYGGKEHWEGEIRLQRQRIVSGHRDGSVRVWDASMETTKHALLTLSEHEGEVNAVAFSPDGSKIASGSNDGTIRIWDAKTGNLVLEPLEEHDDYVLTVSFSPDGKRLVSGGSDGEVRLWDAATGEQLDVPCEGHEDNWAWLRCVAFSRDGLKIAICTSNSIRVWDANMGAQSLMNNGVQTRSVAFSADDKYLFSGHLDGSIRTWALDWGHLEQPSTSSVPPYLRVEASRDIS